jgi:hypothetical protein
MRKSKKPLASSWKWVLPATIVTLALLVLFAGNLPEAQRSLGTLSGNNSLAATGTPAPPTGTVEPIPAPTHTPDPNYSTDALNATAVAIVHELATASPIPSIAPREWERKDLSRLWDAADATARALYPRPPNWRLPQPTVEIPLTPWPTEPIRTAGAGAIYDDSFVQNPDNVIKVTNSWSENVGNQEIVVYAGAKFQYEDPQQGMLMVVIYLKGTWDIASGPELYQSPSRAGKLRTIDAVGQRLTVRAENGTLFYFDVPTRAWVSP